MDTGVERIVDQVVNPKLHTNFVPKIEDVAYQYLGIEKPTNRISELQIDISQRYFPNLDLEQVSPESEKCPSIESHSPNVHNNPMINEDIVEDADDKMDDLESPAFEPIECKIVKVEIVDQDDDKMDISSGNSDNELNISNGFIANNTDEIKSNLSSISGLTSNESLEDSCEANANAATTPIEEDLVKIVCETPEIVKTEPISDEQNVSVVTPSPQSSPVEAAIKQYDVVEPPEEKPSIHYTNDVVENLNQDSVLSQVSSNSRLSIITNNNTSTRMDGAEDDGDASPGPNGETIEKESTCPYGISEEAQMQRFNESSSSNNSLVIDTDHMSNGTNQGDKKDGFVTAFDINKEEIKFEGTERKSFDIDLSEPKLAINDQPVLNDDPVDSNTSAKEVSEIPDTAAASSTETSKDVNFKSEEVSSVSTADTNETSPKNTSLKNEQTSNDAKLGTEDSKGADESSSSSSKHKDRNNRYRSHSERSKRLHSLNQSSAFKDKAKNSRDESNTTDKHREKSKNRSNNRSNSKNHHKSSSSSTKSDKTDNSRSSSSKNYKENEKFRPDTKHRHSSSSSSKHGSKHSESKKSRSDSHRSSSHREKDDHASHREKAPPRKRSRSKDSNDGSANFNNGARNGLASTKTARTDQTTTQGQQNSKEQQQTPTHSTAVMQLNECNSANEHRFACSPSSSNAAMNDLPFAVSVAENDFMLTTQPVVVDQILSGSELNLESFIDENRDNPLVSSIERTLANHAKVKKPKVAANIHEARKLMKLRKEMDRNEQKQLEQARVLAKQYMRSNLTTTVDDSQGVELEFACISSGTNTPGPSISSPVKFNCSKEIVNDEKPLSPPAIPSTSTLPLNQIENSVDDKSHAADFEGFPEIVTNVASEVLQQFELMLQATTQLRVSIPTKGKSQPKKITNRSTYANNSKHIPSDHYINMMSSIDNNRQLFLENNKITVSKSPPTTKSLGIRKRKYTETSVSSDETPSKIDRGDGEMASVVANVIIAPKTESSSARSGLFAQFFSFHLHTVQTTNCSIAVTSTLDKQRQKTRYSNEDLFKPRPVLGGASRSRRRGINCDE